MEKAIQKWSKKCSFSTMATAGPKSKRLEHFFQMDFARGATVVRPKFGGAYFHLEKKFNQGLKIFPKKALNRVKKALFYHIIILVLDPLANKGKKKNKK